MMKTFNRNILLLLYVCFVLSVTSAVRPDRETSQVQPTVRTKNVTVHYCPYPCVLNGHHFCYPIPCPPPACVDSKTTPGDCCPHCPNGPNCGKDGVIVPWKQSKIIDGKNCTCVYPLDLQCI